MPQETNQDPVPNKYQYTGFKGTGFKGESGMFEISRTARP